MLHFAKPDKVISAAGKKTDLRMNQPSMSDGPGSSAALSYVRRSDNDPLTKNRLLAGQQRLEPVNHGSNPT